MEMDESLERLNVALNICSNFRNCFGVYKAKVPSYHGLDGNCVPGWTFDPYMVFNKLEEFVQRLAIIQVRIHNFVLKHSLFFGLECKRYIMYTSTCWLFPLICLPYTPIKF